MRTRWWVLLLLTFAVGGVKATTRVCLKGWLL